MKTIAALTIAALAEASAPYGIESFDDVLEPLWKGIRLLRGKVGRAAVLWQTLGWRFRGDVALRVPTLPACWPAGSAACPLPQLQQRLADLLLPGTHMALPSLLPSLLPPPPARLPCRRCWPPS